VQILTLGELRCNATHQHLHV